MRARSPAPAIEPPSHGIVRGVRLGAYRVRGLIGGGGMSDIFEVRHLYLDGMFALKVGLDPAVTVTRRLVQEARIQSRLQHRNVVRVTDLLEAKGGHMAMVMDLMEGGTLESWLETSEDRSVAAWLPLFEDVIHGVAYAHEQGIVHRDIKPDNVLLQRERSRVSAKITDFGIAKVMEDTVVPSEDHTVAGMSMGSPGYVAAEQLYDAASVDARADLFSLGCLLYRMVFGTPPHEAGTRVEMLSLINRGPPPVPDTDPRFARLVQQLLAPDRRHRLSTCERLIDALCAIPPSALPERRTGPGSIASMPTQLRRRVDPAALTPGD